MSFWSWIGIPDKKDIQALQSEIDSIKEENKAYAEMNAKLIGLVGEISKKCDMISERISDDHTQMNSLMTDNLSRIDILHTEITAIRDDIISVQSNFNDTENHLQNLSADMEKIKSCVSTISDIDSDLRSLTEYVNCLWSATKALWVNSIISELDNVDEHQMDR